MITTVTCFECWFNQDPHNTDGNTEHGFCVVHNDPIGGLTWSDEDFDKYWAHRGPKWADNCRHFTRTKPGLIRRFRAWLFRVREERHEARIWRALEKRTATH